MLLSYFHIYCDCISLIRVSKGTDLRSPIAIFRPNYSLLRFEKFPVRFQHKMGKRLVYECLGGFDDSESAEFPVNGKFDSESGLLMTPSPPYLYASHSFHSQITETRKLIDFRFVLVVRIFRPILSLRRFVHDNGPDA